MPAIDALRSQKGRDRLKVKYLLVNPSNPSTEDLYISEEQLSMACRAPAGASEECRQLWNMMFNDGLTYKDIAAKLGIAERRLRVQHKRCAEKAQAWLKKNS
jgi:DNA-directed RNA polymerase specialized sigma24 family protein